MILYCLIPPGNIQVRIDAFRRSIFRECGVTSPVALPPFIPICWVESLPEDGILEKAARLPSDSLRTGKLALHARALFLSIEPTALFASAKALVKPARRKGIFPLFPGILVYDGREDPALINVIRNKLPGPSCAWSVSSLSFVLIQPEREDRPWWKGVRWEFRWTGRLRKPKATG